MNHRYEFAYLFDCKDGNPNGDPDAGNAPRMDPQDMHGLVSDVCLKRKIRNYVQLAKKQAVGYGIFITEGSVLNEKILEAHNSLGHKLDEQKGATRDQVSHARDEMCRRYFDVRTFGAVLATGSNAGRVRGPVQISFSRSIDPILPLELTITRMAATEAKDDSAKNQTMGKKSIVPYGLYRCHGFVSAHLARETGFSDKDLHLLWEALGGVFDHDRSAARGVMIARSLIAFKHKSALGNAPAHKLFDLVSVELDAKLRDSGKPPRNFSDYRVSVDQSALPKGVELLKIF